MADLVAAGWTTALEEYTRYAWDREAGGYVRQPPRPPRPTTAPTAASRPLLGVRRVVSMQAHADGSARPTHGVASYERGRRAVESLFRAEGWTVARAAIDLDNAEGPDHDGHASVIAPSGPDTVGGTDVPIDRSDVSRSRVQ